MSQVASDAKALVGDELASLLAGLLEGLRAGGDEGMKAAHGLAGAVSGAGGLPVLGAHGIGAPGS